MYSLEKHVKMYPVFLILEHAYLIPIHVEERERYVKGRSAVKSVSGIVNGTRGLRNESSGANSLCGATTPLRSEYI
jgi:hypothetical protein